MWINVLIGAVVGWLTNKIAIKMALYEVKIFGIKLPGTGLIDKYKSEIRNYMIERYNSYIWPTFEKALNQLRGRIRNPVTKAFISLITSSSRIRGIIKVLITAQLERINIRHIVDETYSMCKTHIRIIEVYGAIIGAIIGVVVGLF